MTPRWTLKRRILPSAAGAGPLSWRPTWKEQEKLGDTPTTEGKQIEFVEVLVEWNEALTEPEIVEHFVIASSCVREHVTVLILQHRSSRLKLSCIEDNMKLRDKIPES